MKPTKTSGESIADFKKAWCKHHTAGGMNEKCALGLNIRSITGGPDSGWGLRKPCCRKEHAEETRAVCDKFEAPSDEEIQKEVQAFEESMSRMKMCYPLIKSLKQKFSKTGGKGTEKCPGCGGEKLHWSISSYNGHMRMCCETPNCINFIE